MKVHSLVVASALLTRFSEAAPVRSQIPINEQDSSRIRPTRQPNIVFILSDIDEGHKSSIKYLPSVKKHLVERGIIFRNHLPSPSRLSIWTGSSRYAPISRSGDYQTFISDDLNENYLPEWLHGAGYSTYYTGKFLSGHTVDNWNPKYPSGFDGSDFLLESSNDGDFTYHIRSDGNTPTHTGGNPVDVLSKSTCGFLSDATENGRPFFLTIAPTVKQPQQDENESDVEYEENLQHSRRQALWTIDKIVEETIKRLEEHKVLNDTYIIYASDYSEPQASENGYDLIPKSHTPFIIRGPGIPENISSETPTHNIDIAPTIFELTGLPHPSDFDGVPISSVQSSVRNVRKDHQKRVPYSYEEYVKYHPTDSCEKSEGFFHSLWCHGEHAMYSKDGYSLFVIAFGFGGFVSIIATLTYKSFWRRRAPGILRLA